jgi:hypothetical protein
MTLNVGWHFDDPERDDLTGAAGVDEIDLNEAAYVNLRWKANANVETGLELYGWRTRYWDGATSTEQVDNRIQTSLIMTF